MMTVFNAIQRCESGTLSKHYHGLSVQTSAVESRAESERNLELRTHLRVETSNFHASSKIRIRIIWSRLRIQDSNKFEGSTALVQTDTGDRKVEENDIS